MLTASCWSKRRRLLGLPDCRPSLFKHMSAWQSSRSWGEENAIKIDAPLIKMTKAEIIKHGERCRLWLNRHVTKPTARKSLENAKAATSANSTEEAGSTINSISVAYWGFLKV